MEDEKCVLYYYVTRNFNKAKLLKETPFDVKCLGVRLIKTLIIIVLCYVM